MNHRSEEEIEEEYGISASRTVKDVTVIRDDDGDFWFGDPRADFGFVWADAPEGDSHDLAESLAEIGFLPEEYTPEPEDDSSDPSPEEVADHWYHGENDLLAGGEVYAPTSADVVPADNGSGQMLVAHDEHARGRTTDQSPDERIENHSKGWWVTDLEIVPASEVPADE